MDMYVFCFSIFILKVFKDFIGFVNYFLVGLGVMVLGGYGIQFGMLIFIIDFIISVKIFMEDWVKDGVDYIKIL